jgi:hypothetical protein
MTVLSEEKDTRPSKSGGRQLFKNARVLIKTRGDLKRREGLWHLKMNVRTKKEG